MVLAVSRSTYTMCVCVCMCAALRTGGSWSSGESSAGGAVKPPNPGPQQQQPPGAEHPDIAYSMFPVENYELVHSRWEDDVIWDSEVSGVYSYGIRVQYMYRYTCAVHV